MEIVARAFIGILQNLFRAWVIIFSLSPKVVLLTNCTNYKNSFKQTMLLFVVFVLFGAVDFLDLKFLQTS